MGQAAGEACAAALAGGVPLNAIDGAGLRANMQYRG